MQRWFTTIRISLAATNIGLGVYMLVYPMTRISGFAATTFGWDVSGVSYILGAILIFAGVGLMFDPRGWKLAATLFPFFAYNTLTALVIFQPGLDIPSGGAAISLGILALAIAYIGLIAHYQDLIGKG